MKKLLLIFASLFFAGQTFANDSAISGASGTPGNLKATQLAGEHKSIRMVREHIEMRVGRNDYVTDARFVFHNSGPAITVRMGFPESAGGDSNFAAIRKKTSFKEFQTWVDGKSIKATRMISVVQTEEFGLDAYWVKSVRFARGQTRHVRVRYRSEFGSTSDQSQYVFYDFTGGNWKGKVDESTLRVTFTIPGTYGLFPNTDIKSKPVTREKNNEILLRWKNWQAQEGYAFRFVRTLPGAMNWAYEPKYLNERDELVAGMKPFIVKGAGKLDPWKVEASHMPSVVLRDRRAFIAIRDFADYIRSHIDSVSSTAIIASDNRKYNWDAQTGSLRFEWPTDRKDAKRHILLLTNGAFFFKLDGKIYDLPISLFMAGKPGNRQLYVPLAPLVEALGGTAKVNTKTMRYWYEVPV